MILFAQDWAKYPTAIVHESTRNESFLRQAAVYQSMGIENCAFLLALINPALEHVDPFDVDNLTQEQIDMIIVECKINPWYYFREVAMVPGQAGAPAIPINANRGNIALWWCFFNHITTCLIQPRQTGKSLSTDELMVYILNVLCLNTLVNLYTKDDKLRKENIERIKDIFGELPPYMNLRHPRNDSNNMEDITVNALGNSYKTHLPQGSEKAARNVGRGFSASINHADEVPFAPNSHISIPAMLSSANAVRDRAAASNAPYGNIFTTTAGKLDEKEGAFMYDILLKSMVWTEQVFDCRDAQHLEQFVRNNSPGREYQINITLSHRQLGKTDEWLYRKMQETKSYHDAADRDYFNVWTSGTVSHPLDPALLKRIIDSANDMVYNQIFKEDYIIRWNVDRANVPRYMAENKTILAIDSSEAGGGDDIGMVWLDVETLDVAAAATINETNLLVFGTWLADHLVAYPNVTCIIERKSSGPALIDILLRLLPTMGVDPYKRLFNLVVQDSDEQPDRFENLRTPLGRREERFYTLNKTLFGFNTAASGRFARSELYGNTLQNSAKRGGDKVYDKQLIQQISGLKEKNGRVDHSSKNHDDLVIAWLLAHWFLSNGKNLSWYGISNVMARMEPAKELTYEEYMQQQVQTELQAQLNSLSEQLSNETDDYASQYLEHQMRVLAKRITNSFGELNSIDQLINNIKEERKKRRRVAVASSDQNVTDLDFYQNVMRNSGYRYGGF